MRASPATAAAASRWPTSALTDPSAQEPAGTAGPKARAKPSTSMGSPSAVPVPCASTYPIAAGSTPARPIASATTSACAAGLGTV